MFVRLLFVAAMLGVTAWTSARLGYRHGVMMAANSAPVCSVSEETHWQYQTYDCGKKSDSFANSRRISEVINSYAAKGFEPCSPPAGIFPEGVESDRLIWFRRQNNSFSLAIPTMADNRPMVNGPQTTDN